MMVEEKEKEEALGLFKNISGYKNDVPLKS